MARPYCQFSAQRVAAPWCFMSHDDVAVPASARARRRSSAASMYAAGMLLAGLPALFSVANLLGSTAAPPAGGHPEVGLGFLGPAASSSSGAARSSSRSLSDNGLPGGDLLSPAGATSLASSGVAGAIIAAGLATAAAVTALRRSTGRRSSVMIMRAGKEISEFSEGEVVEGKVARKADIGIWIDIGAIKDALLPKDSMDEKFFDSIRVGDPITVKITKAQDGDTAEDRKILVAYEVGVEEGDKVTAIVDNTAAFGVFVTFDGKKGLVPIRFTKKDDISEYSTGEELELTVVSVEANRVTLSETGATTSRRSQAPKVGERIKGKVKTVAEFGVFVTTNTPFDCLLPGSQLAKELDEYEEDDEIEFDIVNVSPSPDGKGFRVGGTDRLAEKNFSDFQVNQVVKGTVTSLQTFGAFIDVGAPRDALLTAREIEQEGLDLQIDQELDVTVVSVTAKGILVSSRGPAAAVNIGDEVEVKITRVAAFGIFVSGGSGSDYLAPNRFLMKRAVEYVVGETLVVEVIQIEGGRVTVKEVGRVAATVEEGTTFAEVTIRRADVGSGLIVDLGNGFDARIPLQALPKPITEYSAGETLPDVMITRVLDDITLARLDDSPPFSLLEFSDLSMGMKVSGKVVKAETWGVYVDIGAIRAAYLDVEDGVDLTATYTIGQEIEDLRISGCNPQAQELSVTTGKIVTDFAQGDEVKATVKRVTPNALIVGIEGLGRDAIAPRSLLKQDLSEYSEGDKFECQVARIDQVQNSMAVSTKPVTKRMKVIFESLADVRQVLNEEVDGVILNKVKNIGIFIDIGLKGIDVLAPNALLGTNKTQTDYEVGQEVKVWIAEVDLRRTRVSVSMEAPGEGGFRTGRGRGDEEDGGKGGGKGGQRGDEDFRVAGSIWRTGARAGQMTRYVKIMLTDKNEFSGISKQEEAPKSEEDKEREKKVAINDGKEESPFGRILDLAEAYPGIVNVHDFMLPPETRASKGGGYKRDAMGYSTVMDIEVPEHLQKVTEDSEESSRMPWKKVELVEKGGRRVMETHYRDILQGDNIGWEKKIKPEIHIKYRSPPLNHPEFIELPEFIPEGALEAMGVKPQTAKIHITPPGGDEPEEAAEEPAEEGEAESPAEEQPEP